MSFPRRRESRDVRRLSSMDSCFRRNDNLVNTRPFIDLAERLERRWAGIEDITPMFAT